MKYILLLVLALPITSCKKKNPEKSTTNTEALRFSVRNNNALFFTNSVSVIGDEPEFYFAVQNGPLYGNFVDGYIVYADLDYALPGTYQYTDGDCDCNLSVSYLNQQEIFTPMDGTITVVENDQDNQKFHITFEMSVVGDSSGIVRHLSEGHLKTTY